METSMKPDTSPETILAALESMMQAFRMIEGYDPSFIYLGTKQYLEFLAAIRLEHEHGSERPAAIHFQGSRVLRVGIKSHVNMA